MLTAASVATLTGTGAQSANVRASYPAKIDREAFDMDGRQSCCLDELPNRRSAIHVDVFMNHQGAPDRTVR
jgi:hypothetical protein